MLSYTKDRKIFKKDICTKFEGASWKPSMGSDHCLVMLFIIMLRRNSYMLITKSFATNVLFMFDN